MDISRKQAKALGLEIPDNYRRSAKTTVTNTAAAAFDAACQAHGLPIPVHEYVFCEGRKWRFDYCWPDFDLALEVEGGAFTQGRHTRWRGFLADMDKYNTAALEGWFVLRCTPDELQTGKVFELLARAMLPKDTLPED